MSKSPAKSRCTAIGETTKIDKEGVQHTVLKIIATESSDAMALHLLTGRGVVLGVVDAHEKAGWLATVVSVTTKPKPETEMGIIGSAKIVGGTELQDLVGSGLTIVRSQPDLPGTK